MNKLVPLESIQSGMTLASPVKNKFGQLLLPQGAAIEPRHIFMLKTWGVQSVYVQDDSAEEDNSNLDPELVKKAEEELKARMKWKLRYPIEENLFKVGISILLQKRNK